MQIGNGTKAKMQFGTGQEFTKAEKLKLEGIEAGAEVNTVSPSDLSKYIPKWQPNTSYAVGDYVIVKIGNQGYCIVCCTEEHTSEESFDVSCWTNGFISLNAHNDGNGNNIVDTYLTVADVTEALDEKQDALTFDTAPTENSENPVTSGGVFSTLTDKANKQYTLFAEKTLTSEEVEAKGENGYTDIILNNDVEPLTNDTTEILIYIYIPKTGNVNTADTNVGIFASNTDTVGFVDRNIVLRSQSVQKYNYQWSTHYAIDVKLCNGKLIYGLFNKNMYGSYSYGTNTTCFTNSAINFNGAKNFMITSNATDKYKFPADTIVKIYVK